MLKYREYSSKIEIKIFLAILTTSNFIRFVYAVDSAIAVEL